MNGDGSSTNKKANNFATFSADQGEYPLHQDATINTFLDKMIPIVQSFYDLCMETYNKQNQTVLEGKTFLE